MLDLTQKSVENCFNPTLTVIQKPKILVILICFLLLNYSSLFANIDNYVPQTSLSLKPSNLPVLNHIVCINLKRHPEKWENTKALFKKYDIRINKFEAIDGWYNLDCKKFEKECFFLDTSRKLTPGEKGILLSHYSIWKKALEKGLPYIWVLEDDVNIVKDPRLIPSVVQKLNKIDPSWDVLYTDKYFRLNNPKVPPSIRATKVCKAQKNVFNGWLKNRPHPLVHKASYYDRETSISPLLKKVYGRLGLHSVVFSKRGLQKLVNHFKTLQVALPVDVEIFLTPGFNAYSLKNDVVCQTHTNITSGRVSSN